MMSVLSSAVCGGTPRDATRYFYEVPGEKEANAEEVLWIYYPFFYVCFWLPFTVSSKTVMRPK